MAILNQRFDTRQPILTSLADAAKINDGRLPDHVFTQALKEYDADQDEVMNEMIDSKDYKFTRYATGWLVNERNK